MTSFRFNFSNNEEQLAEDTVVETTQWLESEEVNPGIQIRNFDDIVLHAKMFVYGDLEIGHVLASEALTNMDIRSLKNDVQLADDSHSDLLIGKYEGGLKIWECTRDLVQYLVDNEERKNWNDVKVLDLGCGAGILGILAFIKGAFVTFQDYNKEVLECVTIPNVLINIEEEENRSAEIEKCKFYSGDWYSFDNLLDENEVYDYILTSETIYNPENYTKLINVLSHRLKQEGTAFVAAKVHYFGVGGGLRQFESYLQKDGNLTFEVCWKSTGGIQREIIKIRKNSMK